jgi:hypothetical protein
MWYASCSLPHVIRPSTFDPWEVVEAGASTGPCSSGIPSGPIWVLALVVVPVLPLGADDVVGGGAVAGLELLLELDPHPAINAATAKTAIRARIFMRTDNGNGLYDGVS